MFVFMYTENILGFGESGRKKGGGGSNSSIYWYLKWEYLVNVLVVVDNRTYRIAKSEDQAFA